VSRPGWDRVPPAIPTPSFLKELTLSTHHATKPRDFILATMPQFRSYRVPKDAKKMTFLELFADCCTQFNYQSMGIFNLLNGMPLLPDLHLYFSFPIFLGHLARIFTRQHIAYRRGSNWPIPFRHFRGFPVSLRKKNDVARHQIIQTIRQSLLHSEGLWHGATKYGDVIEFTRGRIVKELNYLD
jgi:hypothetical protein